MQRVAVIDYGMGNLGSVAKAVRYVAGSDFDVVVTQDSSVIESAERIVFPGQGAIRDCMAQLNASGLEPVIKTVIDDRPFLGICIGLQALFEDSEEHDATRGFGVFAGSVRRFPAPLTDPSSGERLKVPHMGWNQVDIAKPHPVWHGIDSGERFYFVHSYFVEPAHEGIVAATTEHGVRFCSAIADGYLFACQFHPEKSQRAGLTLLKNFLAWQP